MKKLLLSLIVLTSIFAFSHSAFVVEDASRAITEKVKSENNVYICNSSNAYAYHAYKCRGLKNCKATISEVSESTAQANGYKACKICYD